MMTDKTRLTEEFIRLTAFDSESGEEEAMRSYLAGALREIGIESETDEAGNLYSRLPGTLAGDTVLFSAHMDTVCPGKGKKAVIHPDGKISSDGTTILGADDACGIASILEALRVIRENDLPHPEIELLFTVGEEKYGAGSSRVDYSRLGAKTAYVLDLSGKVGTAAIAAPTLLSLDITVKGKASHAGIAPEEGINALSIAAGALAQLKTGRASPDTTVNFGTIEGGDGKNVVPAQIHITGELRSMRHETALNAVANIEKTFQREAEKLGGSAEVSFKEEIRAYLISEDEPVIRRLRAAMADLGMGEPRLIETFGGSDNNLFVKNGIRGVALATAMELIHSTEEYTEISELAKSAELTLKLMTLG